MAPRTNTHLSGKCFAITLGIFGFIILINFIATDTGLLIKNHYDQLPDETLGALFSNTNDTGKLGHQPESNGDVVEQTITRTVHVITPTHANQAQRPHITRMAQVLGQVRHVHWLLVEDSNYTSSWIPEVARDKGVNLTLIAKRHGVSKIRGVSQRNAALEWLLEHNAGEQDVMYFGDDDNTYDTRVFDVIRNTSTVRLVPVGMFNGPGVSGPIVVNNTVVSFVDPWLAGRSFPVDMACIAVNVGFWRDRGAPLMLADVGAGQGETKFLETLKVTNAELESNLVSHIYVWHTQTTRRSANPQTFQRYLHRFNTSNLRDLGKDVVGL